MRKCESLLKYENRIIYKVFRNQAKNGIKKLFYKGFPYPYRGKPDGVLGFEVNAVIRHLSIYGNCDAKNRITDQITTPETMQGDRDIVPKSGQPGIGLASPMDCWLGVVVDQNLNVNRGGIFERYGSYY